MNVRDYVDRLRESQSTTSDGATPFGSVCGAGSGRTIGDGMYATAKITGTLGVLALLMKALPMLCVCLGGCLLCIRGCLSSVPRPNAQSLMTSQRARPSSQLPTAHASAADGMAWSRTRQSTPRDSRAAGRSRAVDRQRSPEETAADATGEYTDAEPASNERVTSESWESHDGEDRPPVTPWNLPLPSFPSALSENPHRLFGAIRAPSAAGEIDENPLFHAVGGRTFVGTSQQPGQPSARTKLTIDKIREQGREITAHLSLVDRPRVQQAYTGLIEDQPLRLTLMPQRNPQDAGGIFLPYTSWQVGCPTRITLELSKDGQRLAGTSASGEEFEFIPTTPLSLNVDDDEWEEPMEYDGLSVLGDQQWCVLSRNGTAIEDTTDHWCFEPTRQRSGRFRWTRNEEIHAQGTYSEDPSQRRLTIRLQQEQSTRTFRALMAIDEASPNTCQICVASPGASWPKRVDRRFGRVFELLREP